jgi:predicted GNAT superfamily acetyltransferase
METGYIKILTNMNEFAELRNIQRDAWGFAESDIVPVHIFKATADLLKPNGMVLGYYLDDQIIGFVMTLPTSNPKEVLAHIGGVLQKYQDRGIFYKLLFEMKQIMKSNNVDKIFGTYDPLESINAHLYIRKLEGIAPNYYINYYGEIDSKLHHGLPTDRFRIEWILNDKFVEKIKNYNKEIDSDSEDIKYIDIPLNIQELKNKDLDKAIEWRIKTRELFDKYIVKQNFIVVDYIVDKVNKKGVYVLKNFDNKTFFPLCI